MGKHVFTLNLKMEVDSPKLSHGESGACLEISAEALYAAVAGLRNDLLSDLDDLTAKEFGDAVEKATEINAILGQLEALAPYAIDSDLEDDEDEDDD